MEIKKVYKCFIASPSDTKKERDACKEVFETINDGLGNAYGFTLEPLCWEKDVYPGLGADGQDVINRQIVDKYDLFVGIMHTRFGTPTARDESGTMEEFNIAYKRFLNNNSLGIMFYFNNKQVPPNTIDTDQLNKVNEFRENFPNKGMYGTFNGTKDFTNKLRHHLQLYFNKLYENVENIKASITKTSSIAIAKASTYKYIEMWRNVSKQVYNKENIEQIVKDLYTAKKNNRFPKTVFNQDNVIDYIARKKNLTAEDAQLFALAINERGLNPHYYSQLLADYKELNKLPLWQLLKIKEETFNGNTSIIESCDDAIVYENIQRSLFHLDFNKAQSLIETWDCSGYWVLTKAMRMAGIKNKQDTAFAMLNDFVQKESNVIQKFYAIQFANYISNKCSKPYRTDEFFQYGLDGIGDMLEFMTLQLRGKLEKPKSRGWIGTTSYFGGNHIGYEKSLRILRYISDCGLYVSFGSTYFYDNASWYLVFKNLYEEFPYPCFFYSIQYSNEEILRRIGQDFAYSKKLVLFNQDILVKAIQALSNKNGIEIFNKGLLYVISPIYISVDEDVWFDYFKDILFNRLLKDFSHFSQNDALVINIEHALVSLKKPEHIEYVLTAILVRYRENTILADSFVRSNLRVSCLNGNISNEVSRTLELLIADYPMTDITEMMFFLEQENIVTVALKKLFVEKIKSVSVDQLPQDRPSSFYLCLLTKDNIEVQQIAKGILLNHDIWHCGIMEDSKGWSSPNYIRLNVFDGKIEWTDEEFALISDNLKANIEKYDNMHERFYEDSFMKNIQVEYLSDVIRFIEGLDVKKQTELSFIKERVEQLLNDRVSYKTLIEGMLSDQSMDVDYAMDNVLQGVKVKGLKSYLDEINFILDKAIMGKNQNINNILSKIRILVQKYPDDMNDAGLCPKLNTILMLTQKRWDKMDEFRPVWSFNYLYAIAEYLNNIGYEKEPAIKYWMEDKFVQKFIRR